MVYIGTGLMKDFRSGTSKNGNEYNLLELAGEDYAKHTVFVPAEKVADVKKYALGTWVIVKIACEDGLSGSRTSLAAIEQKK